MPLPRQILILEGGAGADGIREERSSLPVLRAKLPPHGGFLGLGTVKDEGTAREQIPVAVRG